MNDDDRDSTDRAKKSIVWPLDDWKENLSHCLLADHIFTSIYCQTNLEGSEMPTANTLTEILTSLDSWGEDVTIQMNGQSIASAEVKGQRNN